MRRLAAISCISNQEARTLVVGDFGCCRAVRAGDEVVVDGSGAAVGVSAFVFMLGKGAGGWRSRFEVGGGASARAAIRVGV